MVNSPWPAVAREVDDLLPKDFFVHQNFDHPSLLRPFVPFDEQFFGTKNLGMFIAQRPYGWIDIGEDQWEFRWPAPEFTEDLLKLVNGYDQFTSYKLLIWVDLYTPRLVQEEYPESDYPQMMRRTAQEIERFCADKTYIEYRGALTSVLPPTYFLEIAQEFLGTQAYRK